MSVLAIGLGSLIGLFASVALLLFCVEKVDAVWTRWRAKAGHQPWSVWKTTHVIAFCMFVIGCLLTYFVWPSNTGGFEFFALPVLLALCAYCWPLAAVFIFPFDVLALIGQLAQKLIRKFVNLFRRT